MKKKFGIVSYNIHGSYTNYGSILQSFALQKAINSFEGAAEAIVVDYWADVVRGKSPLNPLKNVDNVDLEFRKSIQSSMPSIRENYKKINSFIQEFYCLSDKEYTSDDFDVSLEEEHLDGYVIGSDAIWMIDYFGYDKVFWGNCRSIKNTHSIAYAASFGETCLSNEQMNFVQSCCNNFKAIGIREEKYLKLLLDNCQGEVQQVVDPTMLLAVEDYEKIVSKRLIDEPYILLYSRHHNKEMDFYADRMAKQYGYKIIEISLYASNSDRHIMFYHAGIEEFLSLIKYSENIITNSFHAIIFSVLFRRPFSFFVRENANNKVHDFLGRYGLSRMIINNIDSPEMACDIDYGIVHKMIEENRLNSLDFLRRSLLL